jgi:hypothetical protein
MAARLRLEPDGWSGLSFALVESGREALAEQVEDGVRMRHVSGVKKWTRVVIAAIAACGPVAVAVLAATGVGAGASGP